MKQYRAVCLIKGLKGKYLAIGECVDLDEAAAQPFLKSGSLVPVAPAPPASQSDGPPAPEPEQKAPPAVRKPGRPSKAGARS